MGFFTKLKDKTASLAGEFLLQEKIKRYGEMIDLKVDSENNRVFLKVLLKGEIEPLTIQVNEYSFTKENGADYIIVESINISKEWMNLLAEDLLKNKKFKLPEGIAATVIKMVM